jgi:hypothetical protein
MALIRRFTLLGWTIIGVAAIVSLELIVVSLSS